MTQLAKAASALKTLVDLAHKIFDRNAVPETRARMPELSNQVSDSEVEHMVDHILEKYGTGDD